MPVKHACLKRVAFIAAFATLSGLVVVEAEEIKCKGAFDLIFVLDRSGSVMGHFQEDSIPFVRNVIKSFVSPLLGVSFISFNDKGFIHLDITANRQSIERGLDDLSKIIPSAGTEMHTGLKLALNQMKSKADNVATVVVTLTDGKDNKIDNAVQTANDIRQLGGFVFSVGIGQEVRKSEQLPLIADKPEQDHVFYVDNFSDLPRLVQSIVNRTCIEILSVNPNTACTGEQKTVQILGHGFERANNLSNIICNFRLNDTTDHLSRPLSVRDDRLLCPSPRLPREEKGVTIRVSVNGGLSYVGSNVTMNVLTCSKVSLTRTNITWIVIVGVLPALILLLLFLLWCLYPLMCVGGVEKAPAEEPDSKTQWPSVNASYYGGRGAGGMREMRVDWGGKGSTEEGNKLTPAKDATITEPPPLPPDAKPSAAKACLTGCWASVVSGYTWIASFRPVRKSRARYTVSSRRDSSGPRRLLSSSSSAGSERGSRNSSAYAPPPPAKSPPPPSPTKPCPPTRPPVPQRANTARGGGGGGAPARPPARPPPPLKESS